MFLEDRDEAVLVGLGPAGRALHVGRPDGHGVQQLDRLPIDDDVEVEVREVTWLPPLEHHATRQEVSHRHDRGLIVLVHEVGVG